MPEAGKPRRALRLAASQCTPHRLAQEPYVEELTRRQAEILQLIRTHLDETGFPPTRAEISAHFGFSSPNAAEEHLRALERKGALEILPGASRGLRILQPDGLPVIGRVAAGA